VLYLPLTYSSSRNVRKPGSSAELRTELATPVNRLSLAKPEIAFDDSPLALEADSPANEAADDRHSIQPGDFVLLIVENDLAFASFLLDAARAKGFKGLVTALGAGALTLAAEFKPSAITLDMHLPDMEGWRVLDRIKQDFSVRHIPVCVISTDDSKERAYRSGAMAFIEKPIPSKEVLDRMLDQLHSYVSRPARQVLVALQDAALGAEITGLLAHGNVQCVTAPSLADLNPEDFARFECAITDDDALLDKLERARSASPTASVLGPLPVVVWREGPIDVQRQPAWQARDGYLLREARSVPRVIDLAMHALHVSEVRMTDRQRDLLKNLHDTSKSLTGKRVLIVDDDMRNIFALATVLEEEGMDIVWADNGHDAIAKVAADPQLSVVLMDIMMPVMDGMVTMQEIRKLPAGKSLPMIAVTAKAMKGDREKCIEAGAWDYLSKPVNTEHLLAVLRAWLPR
jgi:CheY-like chemotaxis protein